MPANLDIRMAGLGGLSIFWRRKAFSSRRELCSHF